MPPRDEYEPDIPAAEREQYAASQPNTVYRLDGRCAVNVTGREVGAGKEDGCGAPAAFKADFYDYRAGVESDGVFSPAEHINVPVCADHEGLFAGQSWLIRSRQIGVAS